MKKTVILCEEKNRKVLEECIASLKELWEEMGYEAVTLYVKEEESSDYYMNELVRMKEDFLVTFAMAGFGWRGLMEQVRFNTLSAMQIHILAGELPQYDFFLKKEYGVQSFFFTDNESIFENWKEKYPGVPFMGLLPKLHTADRLSEVEKRLNRIHLKEMLQHVMEFIEKPSVL